jgi:hypothetical protein
MPAGVLFGLSFARFRQQRYGCFILCIAPAEEMQQVIQAQQPERKRGVL